MKYGDNIPSFNDICGTVTQALAEIILNREAIIAELREDNARAEHLLLLRDKQVADLRKQIEGWRTECEVHEKDEKELYSLRDEVRRLRTQLHTQHMDCDAQCGTLLEQRDDARRQYCELVHNLEATSCEKIAHFNGWNDLYSIDNTPSLFEQSEVRRTRRSDFTEQQSDSDPATGVQYGDLN